MTDAYDQAMADTVLSALFVGAGFGFFLLATAIGPYFLLKSSSQWWRVALALFVGISTGIVLAAFLLTVLWSLLQPTDEVRPADIEINQRLFIGTVFWGTMLGVAFGFRRASAFREHGQAFIPPSIALLFATAFKWMSGGWRPLLTAIGCFVALSVGLLLTGSRLLIWVQPAMSDKNEKRGGEQARYVCYYFTGSGIITTKLPNATNDLPGRETCSLFLVHSVEITLGRTLEDEKSFRDCSDCPEMIGLPAGYFLMGSAENEVGRDDDEGPIHWVSVPPFAIGRFEVTVGEWKACVRAGGCEERTTIESRVSEPERLPMVNVSWDDVQEYVRWLTQVTGHPYRLPSEAEWEYAARAGSHLPYAWGRDASPQFANFSSRDETGKLVAPVGSLRPNVFGIYDASGNVFEWVADCYELDYTDAPVDGSAKSREPCVDFVLRGGSYGDPASHVRSANRTSFERDARRAWFGFRVVRTY
jgi:formylglycine-generating enzyme required for sulfatase activity